MVNEEIHQPVVDRIWDIQQSHLALTVSEALEKPRAVTITNGSVAMRSVMVCNRATSAVVVDAVGRKAYWLPKDSGVRGSRIAGFQNSLTVLCSSVL